MWSQTAHTVSGVASIMRGTQCVGSSLVRTFDHDIVEPQRKALARESSCSAATTFLHPHRVIGSVVLSEAYVSPQKDTLGRWWTTTRTLLDELL